MPVDEAHIARIGEGAARALAVDAARERCGGIEPVLVEVAVDTDRPLVRIYRFRA